MIKIAWIQAWVKDKKAFPTPQLEKQITSFIEDKKLQEGKIAKQGDLSIKLIKISEVEGELRGNGDIVILPALSENVRAEHLKEWVDWSGDFKEVLRTLWLQEQIALVGEKGTGKNKLMEVIAKIFSLPYYEIPSSEDLTSYDIVGKFIPTEKANQIAKWQDGILTEWLKTKGILVWDEPNVTRGGILLRTHSVLDFRRNLTLKEHKGEVIQRPEGCYLALTFNPPRSEYLGVEALNIAFLDRFPVFTLDYPPEDAEIEIVDGVNDHIILTIEREHSNCDTRILVKIANKIREAYAQGQIHDTVSTRQLQLARKLIDNGMSVEKALKITIVNRFFAEQRAIVSEFCEIANEGEGGR
jgi:MoxR-like ATPase